MLNPTFPDIIVCDSSTTGSVATYIESIPDENGQYTYRSLQGENLAFQNTGSMASSDFADGDCYSNGDGTPTIDDLRTEGITYSWEVSGGPVQLSTDPLLVALFAGFLLVYTANYVRRLFYS